VNLSFGLGNGANGQSPREEQRHTRRLQWAMTGHLPRPLKFPDAGRSALLDALGGSTKDTALVRHRR
jgi:hypothetical protein